MQQTYHLKSILFQTFATLFIFVNSPFAQEINYDEAKAQQYELSDLLTSFSGKKIKNFKEWEKVRRPEI